MSGKNSYRPDLESADVEWIDDAFCIYKTRFGLYTSIRKDTKKNFLTGATYDSVLEMSRWHLMCEQEGTLEQYTRVIGDAFVGGKL
jgi:hypothetical protein|tara:strand:+ start:642 stop:899 length:258 start_codon:yes stop_codon:yes gene_type:complete